MFNPVFGNLPVGLCRQGVNASHIVHILGKMMDVVCINPVVFHAIDGFCPAPAHTNTGIVQMADFIVFDVNIVCISNANAHATPVFVGTVGDQVIFDSFELANFPFVGSYLV